MSLSTHANQSTGKEIQKFLHESIHFEESHTPVEEWWENRGHTIHLNRWRSPDARVRVIMHGVGTNGRQMSLLLSVPLNAGFEAVAVDMPMYGMTKLAAGTTVACEDWVNIGDDFVNFELEHGPRPVALYGLSAGRMLLTSHIAAPNKKSKVS
jgi:alpha-beta hydrolase superfamily lysophospholipase